MVGVAVGKGACRGALVLIAGISVGGCDAVLGLGNLKDEPDSASILPVDGGPAQSDGPMSDAEAPPDSTADVADATSSEASDGTLPGLDGGDDAVSPTTIAAPRPISPLSTALATSQQPTFRWALADGTTGAQIDICLDRACTSLVQTFAVAGASGAPSLALARGVYFWRLHGMVGATVGTSNSPVWEIRVGARSAQVDTSWGTLVDPNGDGVADLVVGAAKAGTGGTAYIYSSAGVSGLSISPTAIDPGPGNGGDFGFALAGAGDTNGDGFTDVVVGAPDGNGIAYVYLGGQAGLSQTPIALQGPGAANTHFGQVVASAGDVNRDGYADVIVTAAGISTGYIYLGGAGGIATSASTTLSTPAGGGSFGGSASSAGDINGDGFGEVVVGAPTAGTAGMFYAYLGGPGGLSTTPAPYASPSSGGGFGYAIAGADDVNGDGYADVLVGANDPTGAAYVYLGGETGLSANPVTLTSPAGASGFFGNAVSGAGDLNGDGFGDVIIGAFEANSGIGGAWVYLGSTTASLTTITPLINPASGSAAAEGWFGATVSEAGDVNGDGLGDVAIGAPENSGSAGNAYVFLGTATGAGVSTSPATSLSAPAAGQFGEGIR